MIPQYRSILGTALLLWNRTRSLGTLRSLKRARQLGLPNCESNPILVQSRVGSQGTIFSARFRHTPHPTLNISSKSFYSPFYLQIRRPNQLLPSGSGGGKGTSPSSRHAEGRESARGLHTLPACEENSLVGKKCGRMAKRKLQSESL